MKLLNYVNFKDEREVENLFKANSQQGYSSTMTVISRFRDALVDRLSKMGENSKEVDPDELLKTLAQLSFCDQFLQFNTEVKRRATINAREED